MFSMIRRKNKDRLWSMWIREYGCIEPKAVLNVFYGFVYAKFGSSLYRASKRLMRSVGFKRS